MIHYFICSFSDTKDSSHVLTFGRHMLDMHMDKKLPGSVIFNWITSHNSKRGNHISNTSTKEQYVCKLCWKQILGYQHHNLLQIYEHVPHAAFD